MEILNLIGGNVRFYREKNHLSQEKLALRAGVDRTYIPKVEKGYINVTIKSLEKVAKALNITIIDLLTDNATPK